MSFAKLSDEDFKIDDGCRSGHTSRSGEMLDQGGATEGDQFNNIAVANTPSAWLVCNFALRIYQPPPRVKQLSSSDSMILESLEETG